MASVTPRNDNDNIYELLSLHNFTLINQSIDEYKCVICQRILINAHQASCGCHYCQKCVDEQVGNGVVFCPGDTEECKTAPLSNVVINHRLNKQISRLIVKCPEGMCHYESQLRDMGDHLRLCGKRNVDCPFIDFGCDQRAMKMDELNEHLQQESYRHSEILIDVIGNLRNELAELKRDREKYDEAIDKLVKSDREKTAIIDLMREEMELMKMEKAAMEQRLDNVENLLDDKADKIDLVQREDNLGYLLDDKADKMSVAEIEVKLEEMRREWRGAMEQQQLSMAKAKERNKLKYRREIAERIDAVEKCLAEKIDADLLWTIDNIAEKRKVDKFMDSEYFNGCAEAYKMRLGCYCAKDELLIWFGIFPGDSDDSLPWPFVKNIKIAITNRMRPDACISVAKRCTITKPNPDLYSDAFKFKWTELTDEGLLFGGRLTVRCFIRDG